MSIMRAPTTPGVAAHSAMSSAIDLDVGSKGRTRPNLPGYFAYTCRA